jgi:aminopeptidase N
VRAVVLFLCVTTSLAAAPLPRPYTAENYDVRIQADLGKQYLSGEAAIRVHSQAGNAVSALEFDAGSLEIASVLEGDSPQPFERDRSLLIIVLTNPLQPDQSRTLTVKYQAGPAAGLKFFPDQIYTSVTSDWMPCNDRPGERATLHLTITAPMEMNVAGSGRLTATHAGYTQTTEAQTITEWQLDSPAEPSWFGFALGAFPEKTSDADSVKLRVLGSDTPIFEPTTAAMHYLAERTGKHYPGQTYTQVLIHGDVSRAMAGGLTLLPQSYAQGLTKQPEDLWLLADELAHQWYGAGIAVKDWSDLWLSEGVSAFVTDAFLGQRFGKARYDREIQNSRQIFNRLHAEGKDPSLSNTAWTTRQDADGESPEHKGAWFLYLVNQLIGDSAFWNGLRLYTSDQWNRAAASEDLQRAFDAAHTSTGKKGGATEHKVGRKGSAKSSGTPVDNLFDMWVYGIPNSTSR